ncbi:6897_t:CDS:10 [Ambispora gerdemannii]|uniref:Pheromone-processing carboxypeptidase KEX1 n=1 Tax=Ambispora gerdemannii TaxID=144530 RepID=A0A9N8UZC4_9GLOM|nr:6897_t:CDS:10 [Ambispora gerdemannii]
MDGLFLEIGPWRMNKDQTLRMINGSWDEYANLLFVDQPIGTGFSFGESNSYPTTLTESTEQFLTFLDKFFEIFPEYAKDEIYIAGESFAGTYIPYISSAILKRNNERKTVEYQKVIRRIAIGNGWIDPIAQGLLTGDSKTRANKALKECMSHLKDDLRINDESCEEILNVVLDASVKTDESGNKTCVNQYDIRLTDSYPDCGMKWPYDLETITEYLRRTDVIGAIHADAQKIGWKECSGQVGTGFDKDISPPSVKLLPEILSKIPVLLFSGDQDLICNTNGTQDLIAGLEWNNGKGFQNSNPEKWYVNGSLTGTWQTERNLSFVIFHNASHMVPYDAALGTMDMIDRFMGLKIKFDNLIPSRVENEKVEDVTNSTAGSLNNEPSSKVNASEVNDESDEMWDRYYNAGTASLVIVIMAVIGLVVFLFRGKLFRRMRSVNQAMKAVVDSNENTEMQELVIETPLFGLDDDEVSTTSLTPYNDEQGNHETATNTPYKDVSDDDQGNHGIATNTPYKDESDDDDKTKYNGDDDDNSGHEIDHERNNTRLQAAVDTDEEH